MKPTHKPGIQQFAGPGSCKFERPEKLGSVEIGLFCSNRIPGDVMRHLQFVAAFVKISPEYASLPEVHIMMDQCAERDCQGESPGKVTLDFADGTVTGRCKPADLINY